MVKKLLLIIAFFLNTSIYCSSPEYSAISYSYESSCTTKTRQQRNLSGLVQKYMASFIAGSIIGAASGGVCAAADNKLGLFPISWIIFPLLRSIMIDAISDDFDSYGVRHNPGLMAAIARLSDWIVYLSLWNQHLSCLSVNTKQ